MARLAVGAHASTLLPQPIRQCAGPRDSAVHTRSIRRLMSKSHRCHLQVLPRYSGDGAKRCVSQRARPSGSASLWLGRGPVRDHFLCARKNSEHPGKFSRVATTGARDGQLLPGFLVSLAEFQFQRRRFDPIEYDRAVSSGIQVRQAFVVFAVEAKSSVPSDEISRGIKMIRNLLRVVWSHTFIPLGGLTLTLPLAEAPSTIAIPKKPTSF